MIKITKTELSWLRRTAHNRADEARTCLEIPNQQYKALWQLELENMAALVKKLDAIIASDAKRIEIG